MVWLHSLLKTNQSLSGMLPTGLSPLISGERREISDTNGSAKQPKNFEVLHETRDYTNQPTTLKEV